MVIIKSLRRQDRTVARTPQDVERRHRFNLIEPTAQELEELKEDIVVDSNLSIDSAHPVENRVITEALSKKVNVEEGKGLSSNDFTDTYIERINVATGKSHVHDNKSILDSFTNEYVADITDATNKRHTHSNKSILDSITQSDINNWNESVGSSSAIYQEYHSDYSGYVWFNDGFLVQWGRTSVTPTAVNTDTTARITYTYSYDNIPDRKTEVSSATPSVAKVTSGGGTTTTLSKQGMNLYVNSSTTRAVTIDWLATGYKGT